MTGTRRLAIAIATLLLLVAARVQAQSPDSPPRGRVAPAQVTLTVQGGSGSGTYHPGERIAITATVPAGQVFDRWLAPPGTVDVPTSATNAVVTMPTTAVTIIASFTPPPRK